MRTIMAALAATTVLAVFAARAVSSEPAPVAAQTTAGVHDFDFIVGEWRTHHRRLKDRLAGSHEWIEFEGTQSARLEQQEDREEPASQHFSRPP